jgi:hypothetical protein
MRALYAVIGVGLMFVSLVAGLLIALHPIG